MKIRLDERTEKLTERIIGSGFEVLNELGHGLPEAVYQKALAHELAESGISVEKLVPAHVGQVLNYLRASTRWIHRSSATPEVSEEGLGGG